MALLVGWAPSAVACRPVVRVPTSGSVVAESTLGGWTEVDAGVLHACGLHFGTPQCWGHGAGPRTKLPARGTVTGITVGREGGCGLDASHLPQCWCLYDFGPTSPLYMNRGGCDAPPAVPLAQVSSGGHHTCGVGLDGEVVCWGNVHAGLIEFPDPPDGPFASVTSGYEFSCGLRESGEVECWGEVYGPSVLPAGGPFVQIDSGQGTTCGLTRDGALSCAGNVPLPETVAARRDFVSVTVGGFHACALTAEGLATCWGKDDEGEASPPPDVQFAALSAGTYSTCGLTRAATVVCWGTDRYRASIPP